MTQKQFRKPEQLRAGSCRAGSVARLAADAIFVSFYTVTGPDNCWIRAEAGFATFCCGCTAGTAAGISAEPGFVSFCCNYGRIPAEAGLMHFIAVTEPDNCWDACLHRQDVLHFAAVTRPEQPYPCKGKVCCILLQLQHWTAVGIPAEAGFIAFCCSYKARTASGIPAKTDLLYFDPVTLLEQLPASLQCHYLLNFAAVTGPHQLPESLQTQYLLHLAAVTGPEQRTWKAPVPEAAEAPYRNMNIDVCVCFSTHIYIYISFCFVLQALNGLGQNASG